MDITPLVKASGKTRAEICKEAGISQAYLSLMEHKHRKVGLRFVRPLANALGVSPVALRPDLVEALLSVEPVTSRGNENESTQAPKITKSKRGAA